LALLELVGVVVVDGGVERLNRCSLTVRPGEVLGLAGPTASGKSTLLAVAAGQRSPERGRVTWEGREVTRSPERLRARAALAGHELPGPRGLAIEAWLALWASLDGVPAATLRERSPALLTRFELTRVKGRPVETLSRGEARRLGWVRAWLAEPKLLLLDAPDDGVDGAGLRILTLAVREAASAGATVILACTAPPLATSLCDRVAVLQAGAVVHDLGRAEPGFAAGVAAGMGWTS